MREIYDETGLLPQSLLNEGWEHPTMGWKIDSEKQMPEPTKKLSKRKQLLAAAVYCGAISLICVALSAGLVLRAFNPRRRYNEDDYQ